MTLQLALALLALSAANAQKTFTPPPSRPDVKTPAPHVVKMPMPAAVDASTFAPDHAPAPIPAQRVAIGRPLIHDVDEHAAQWVRGRTYKARFGGGSAEYIRGGDRWDEKAGLHARSR